MSLQRVQISDMLNALQVIFKSVSIGPLHCHLFFLNQNILIPAFLPLPQTIKHFLNELKLRRTTPTRKEEKRVLLV